MPEFDAKCDHCKITFRAHVYGFRARKIANCPRCLELCKSYRNKPEGYTRLVFRGMENHKPVWEPDR